MFCFLRKTIPFRRLIVFGTISPETILPELLCFQRQWLSARYCNSVASNRHSFTVSYLIDTCGFSPQEAASVSKLVSFESRDKPDLVINFFKSQGLTKPQIHRFVRELPRLLRSDPQKTLVPKIEFLVSNGVSISDIPKLLCSCPSIMVRSLSKQIIPSFHFFRDLFQSDAKLIQVVTNFSGILLDLNSRSMPNMKLLREAGVPESNVIKLLQYFPSVITKSCVRFEEIVKEVKELGVNPGQVNFVLAVSVLASASKSTWGKKVDVYKKWGWSEDDILAAFRKYPFIMKASKDKIDAVMDFLVNKLGCESSIVAKYPGVISFSMKRRFLPRGAVIKILLSKGLVQKESLPLLFMYPESTFLRRFIMSNLKEEATQLLKLYQGKLKLAR
ncbi:transcription termination factor MTERF9, chloroplastic-like [Neltuma alba]|uniref:transcription termination factor MTERF9, chloroplastic-like n=1 Tax=Neltuma alba TaxID=207710 RepID=UPI0010A4CEE5|nr:transcription termination factor MTERF9, chloroplastic-like [Prosopis alba]